MKKILVIDNYDSFVFNLVQYLEQLGAEVEVVRNDQVDLSSLAQYDGILLSPGPGTPEDAGACIEVVNEAVKTNQPLLGVCLGHQAIGVAFGATVNQAPELLHGKTSEVIHQNTDIFEGLKQDFIATRYHSLAISPKTINEDLQITATTKSGVIMGIRHKTAPIFGVQFHPESVLTEGGHQLLANWLAAAGLPEAIPIAKNLKP
jgi:para-aminobenzoate synthetase component II